MTFTIGIDIGTSAVKAVLVDGRQQVVAEATHHLKTNYPNEGQAEQTPEDWIACTKIVLADLRRQNENGFSHCTAIGLSGQMHGAVLLSSDNRPLRPAILWNDSRAAPQAAQIQREHPELAQRAGVICMASFVAPKLVWL